MLTALQQGATLSSRSYLGCRLSSETEEEETVSFYGKGFGSFNLSVSEGAGLIKTGQSQTFRDNLEMFRDSLETVGDNL